MTAPLPDRDGGPEPVDVPRGTWLPWRSAAGAWACTAVLFVLGVPLFLRLTPWCDLTLYDVAAMNLLRGGVHYRDVFDTNLPGFVWALSGIRAAFGWGVEVVRAFDLLIVAATAAILYRLARRGGATAASAAWAVAGIALFYPFTTEFNHAQRDVWMLLPAAAAVSLRVRRLAIPDGSVRPIPRALAEGILWGLGVWIKPHVIIPAAAVWLATASRVFSAGGRRGLRADLAGNIAGGLTVGLAGIVYLAASGTWPWFVEVFTFWNTGYARQMFSEIGERYRMQLHYFPPWSYLALVVVPIAILTLIDGLGKGRVARVLPRWAWAPASSEGVGTARLALAALYLGWTVQALFFQRVFHYVHIPEIFLLLALLATQRWSAGFLMLAWLSIVSVVCLTGLACPDDPPSLPSRDQHFRLLIRHELSGRGALDRWPDCWRTGLSEQEYRERMRSLRRIPDFHAMLDPVELGEVADWLAARGVKDGEVLCWHDSPHAVYLMLRMRPGFRFQHVNQIMGIGPAQEARVRTELAEAGGTFRYIVSDLMRPGQERPDLMGDFTLPGDGDDLLPRGMRPQLRSQFPFNERAVFRSGNGCGRYVIHVHRPCDPIPWPPDLTEAGYPPPGR